MKKVFYLKDEIQFIESFESKDDIITWIFRWKGKLAFSQALHDLINEFYFEN